jgi:hypothetical protein
MGQWAVAMLFPESQKLPIWSLRDSICDRPRTQDSHRRTIIRTALVIPQHSCISVTFIAHYVKVNDVGVYDISHVFATRGGILACFTAAHGAVARPGAVRGPAIRRHGREAGSQARG